MFDELATKLDAALKKLRQRGVLTEPMIKDGLREVRRVLLEADVNFQVTRDFLGSVQERALGEAVLKAVSPGQQIVKIVHDELANLFGDGRPELALDRAGTGVVLMVGLQGSGKTTSAAKLARRLGREGATPMLAACDLQRPAAIEQLETLGRQIGVPVVAGEFEGDPVGAALRARDAAVAGGHSVLIVDTAGRLQIDERLMDELRRVRDAVEPNEILLVADAMTGQEAVEIAEGLRRGARHHGRRDDQDGRRRPRGRGALHPRRHREAHQVRRRRARASTTSTRPTRSVSPGAFSRWATSSAWSSARRPPSTRRSRRSSRKKMLGQGALHPRGLPRRDASGPAHGPPRAAPQAHPRGGR